MYLYTEDYVSSKNLFPGILTTVLTYDLSLESGAAAVGAIVKPSYIPVVYME